jgi:CelD/BcsL family acetyltransferase involved in cellulose biosynthesis
MHDCFVEPSDPRWAETLARVPHDVYHLPDYVAVEARRQGGRALAYFAAEGEHRLLIPLVVRPIEPAAGGPLGAWWDATSPYGYPGPLLAPGWDADAFFARAVPRFVAGLRHHRVVTAFVRLHPLLPVPSGPLADFGPVVQHGETVSIDLSRPSAALWQETRHNHRRDIQRAAARGQVARIDEGWGAIEAFVEVYHETMRRVGAEPSYFFPPAYLHDLRGALGSRLHLCAVEVGGAVVAAGLFTEIAGIVQYFLGGTRAEFLRESPAKTMFHFVRGWAKERGNRVFHLGGGLGGRNDSLFAFKAGFSHARHPFATWRVVVDELAYGGQVGRWEAVHGAPADDGPDGFFPAYRKPAPAAGDGPPPVPAGAHRCR